MTSAADAVADPEVFGHFEAEGWAVLPGVLSDDEVARARQVLMAPT